MPGPSGIRPEWESPPWSNPPTAARKSNNKSGTTVFNEHESTDEVPNIFKGLDRALIQGLWPENALTRLYRVKIQGL